MSRECQPQKTHVNLFSLTPPSCYIKPMPTPTTRFECLSESFANAELALYAAQESRTRLHAIIDEQVTAYAKGAFPKCVVLSWTIVRASKLVVIRFTDRTQVSVPGIQVLRD